MAMILNRRRLPPVTQHVTIFAQDAAMLRMSINDATTRTMYDVWFDNIGEFEQFLKANDSERAQLIKHFKG